MSRKRDMTDAVYEALKHVQIKSSLSLSQNDKLEMYNELNTKFGRRAADIGWAIIESKATSQNINLFLETTSMNLNYGTNTTNVTQTAGGNQVGVNATGDQKINDITIYSQDLLQNGNSLSKELKDCLISIKQNLSNLEVANPIKDGMLTNFDAITTEIKKGDKGDKSVITTLWSMICTGVSNLPSGSGQTVIAGLQLLKSLAGF